MNTAILIMLAALALILPAGCGEPDVAACKEAMRAQYVDTRAHGTTHKMPQQCKGIDSATLTRLAEQIVKEES